MPADFSVEGGGDPRSKLQLGATRSCAGLQILRLPCSAKVATRERICCWWRSGRSCGTLITTAAASYLSGEIYLRSKHSLSHVSFRKRKIIRAGDEYRCSLSRAWHCWDGIASQCPSMIQATNERPLGIAAAVAAAAAAGCGGVPRSSGFLTRGACSPRFAYHYDQVAFASFIPRCAFFDFLLWREYEDFIIYIFRCTAGVSFRANRCPRLFTFSRDA